MPREVIVVADAPSLAREGAVLVRAAIRDAIQARERCHLALAGGKTPRGVYERLANHPTANELPAVDWTAVEFWFGDERHVPPDHPDSNYRMAREALLAHLPIADAQVHRMRTEEADAAQAAALYEAELRRVFGLGPDGWPALDVALLGMGADGHTASLFPGTPVVDERARLAAAVWAPSMKSHRVTLTLPIFTRARRVIVFVSGADKAETLQAVLEGPREVARLPIQGVDAGAGAVTFLVDAAAAARLRPETRTAGSGR